MHKNIVVRIVSLCLVMVMAFMLISCFEKTEYTKGINVIKAPESYVYSEAAEQYAELSLYSFLATYEEKKEGKPLTKNQIDALNEKVQSILQRLPDSISEPQYTKFYGALSKCAPEFADGVLMLRTQNKEDAIAKLKKSYILLNEIVGADYIGALIYTYAENELDKKIEAQLKAYEQYGHSYLLEKAEEYQKSKSILNNDIGLKNTTNFVKYVIFVADLYYGGAFEQNKISSFTDEEILILAKSMDLGELTITKEGYNLILSSYAENVLLDKNKSFFDKAIYEAWHNGDIEHFALFIEKSSGFISKLQQGLTMEDIALLRNGKGNEVLISILQNLDSSDWDELDKVMKHEIKKKSYNKIASDYWGSDFDEYEKNHQSATIDELKQAIGKEDFKKVLKEYIAGICPAFSYYFDKK